MPAAVSWQFDGTATPSGGSVELLGGKPAFVATDKGQGLAPGVALQYADAAELRLRPEMEIRCRFRLDELPEHPRALVMKNGEYLLRMDGTKEGGYLSFYVQIEGRWEPRLRGPVVQAGAWYEVRVVWSGQSMRMDVNGERFEQTRFGRIRQGTEPLQIGPIAGVIDYLELRNPSLERAALLATMPADGQSRIVSPPAPDTADPIPADKPILAGQGRWEGWQAMNGATRDVGGSAITTAFPSGSSMLVSPALACDLTPRPFICLDIESIAPGSTGYVDIVTDAGMDSISFQPQSDGRPTIIDGAMSEVWTGTLRRLALSFSGGEGPVVIRQIAVADRPIGTPVFYIRSLAAGRAKLRPTREETVIAGIQNVGGEAEHITARLTVPEGLELLGQETQTIPYLGMDDFDMTTWRIRAAKPGTYTVHVEVAAKGAKTQSKDITLVVDPQPDLPAAD
ncbi:MAG: LamG-like jellyroll fold domain-containing protein, partial [Patescibacteria group bacterium]|nr:LamG-like jellyroll fold domain-containing protein [Patescibacteria group bacterium]